MERVLKFSIWDYLGSQEGNFSLEIILSFKLNLHNNLHLISNCIQQSVDVLSLCIYRNLDLPLIYLFYRKLHI